MRSLAEHYQILTHILLNAYEYFCRGGSMNIVIPNCGSELECKRMLFSGPTPKNIIVDSISSSFYRILGFGFI